MSDRLEQIYRQVEAMDGQCHDGEGLGCEASPCVENVSRADVLALFALASQPEPLDVERLAALLDTAEVADLMGGPFESGEITRLSRYLAARLSEEPR